jgi:hypothetical protein
MLDRYPIDQLSEGFNILPDEEVYFIANPSLGLWALRTDFE